MPAGVSLRRRVEALEKDLITEPAILTMPDGSTVTIPGGGDYLLRLLEVATHEESASPEETKHLDLIRCSRDAREPGGGRITEVIRVLLHGPVETSTAEHDVQAHTR
jgi:hypothetical protein